MGLLECLATGNFVEEKSLTNIPLVVYMRPVAGDEVTCESVKLRSQPKTHIIEK